MAIDDDATATDLTITVDDEALAEVLRRLNNIDGVQKIVFDDFEVEIDNGHER
jgi:hypothetical protein